MNVWLALALIATAVWVGAGVGYHHRQLQERDERHDDEENGEWS